MPSVSCSCSGIQQVLRAAGRDQQAGSRGTCRETEAGSSSKLAPVWEGLCERDTGPRAWQQGGLSLAVGRPGACPTPDNGPTASSPSAVFSRAQRSSPSSSLFPAQNAVPGSARCIPQAAGQCVTPSPQGLYNCCTSPPRLPGLWLPESRVSTQVSCTPVLPPLITGMVWGLRPASSPAVVQAARGLASLGCAWVALAPCRWMCLLWVPQGGRGSRHPGLGLCPSVPDAWCCSWTWPAGPPGLLGPRPSPAVEERPEASLMPLVSEALVTVRCAWTRQMVKKIINTK